jgi:hypothetical protein
LWRLQEDDWVENEIITFDWSRDSTVCTIQIGKEIVSTVVDRPQDIYRAIEAEFGLEEIYLCDRNGKPVDHETEFDGGHFTTYQCYERKKWNKAVWPEEDHLEWVKDGTGAEVRERIEEQVGRQVEVKVIKEGTIPMLRNLKDEEICEDLEFRILPMEKMPTPEYRAWHGTLVRRPDYKTRRSQEYCRKEERRPIGKLDGFGIRRKMEVSSSGKVLKG